MGTASFWWDSEMKLGSPGEEIVPGLRTGVCVIGAGMAGLSVAYALARAGVDVVVIDRGPVGGGETGRTTAHLASALDDHFFRLERLALRPIRACPQRAGGERPRRIVKEFE